jgi:GTP diphosphokinase / guanosine-3',5'-bis(diphosphate) 3'-diphosphatase
MTSATEGAERLLSLTRKHLSKSGQRQVEKAYRFAELAHDGQFRKSGDPYITHPVAVATNLAELELDVDTISAALLHDVVEDTPITLSEIRDEFGEEIAYIIDGVTKLERFKFSSREERQAENMRKMLIAMAGDVRVILIKLSDRLHNMQTIRALEPDQRRTISEETLEIYGPLAHRFGISQMKWRLEDLAFEQLYPKRYEEIRKMVAERRAERELFMKQVEKEIADQLKRHKVKADVSGRVKHFYSIYEKMVNRDVEFDEIMDLTAVRVIVDNVRDCYAALGVIHSVWMPVPGRFKDYIAMPKLNMYRSLHTVVISLEGRPLEIQIRTAEMHRTAEFGIAAHWLYKETSRRREHSGRQWLKQVMEWQEELQDPTEFMKTLKVDLFQDEVFAFTPAGKLIAMPRGSTPIDFAYSIHTEVGHHCVGSKVNGKMVPLAYQLQNGDIVEIMTSKTSPGPSQDWMGIVETTRARNKIRQWFSRERREDERHEGKEMLDRAMRKRNLPLHKKEVSRVLNQVAEDYHCDKVEDLYRQIGAGHYSAKQVANKVAQYLGLEKKDEIVPEGEPFIRPPAVHRESEPGRAVHVVGVDNALVTVAQCCNPGPGDPIVGFVTRGRGVSVHSRDCTNVQGLLREADRLIEVSWGERVPTSRVIELMVEAMDRQKLVRDITTVLGDQGVNILSASFSADSQHIARSTYLFEIGSRQHLEEIIRELKKVDAVYDVFEAPSEAETAGE